MRRGFLLFLVLISGQIFSQYYYLPSTTQGNPGGLNTDNEYPSGSGLDASWEVLLGGSNSTPVWSPIDTIPFNSSLFIISICLIFFSVMVSISSVTEILRSQDYFNQRGYML